MEREWHKIISFNGSQANAFEELVCQVAMAEENSKFSHFERVGTPDGGVECYWQLKDKSEWGWQAKYYENLASSEWNNIKKSLFDAIETHPKLVKYVICIPHNLADGRRGRISQKDSWEEHKRKWTEEFSSRGKTIELELWNSSTLLSKLLLNKNSGIKSLFLGDIEIKLDQLFLHLDAAIANLGPKYSPDLNFTIDYLPMVFDALSRNSKFQESFKNKLDILLQELNEVASNCTSFEETKGFRDLLSNKFKELITIYEKTNFLPQNEIPTTDFIAVTDEIRSYCNSLREVYSEIEAKFQLELKEKKNKEDKEHEYREYYEQKTDRETQAIYKYLKSSGEMSTYLTGPVLRAANEGVIFLKGKPGSGKSHLLADIALNRKAEKIPTIFLLGEHFTTQQPKINIQQFLCPNLNLESYLKALETLAKARQVRLLFIIDAINEGPGKYIWKSSIAGLLKELSQFKWIGFVFSYRSTYEDIVIPDNLSVPLIDHKGFEGIEYEATKKFFEYYKIQQPTIPLLNPEFSNPLFLKTFCVALNKAGKSIIPEGYEGISRILEEYLDAVNKNIGIRIDYPYLKINLVSRAINELVKYQIETDDFIIPWEKAFTLVEPLLKTYSNKTGFLEELIKEGVFIEDYFYNYESRKYEQHGVAFNYERFNEHLKAIYLLSSFSSVKSLRKAFSAKGKLRALFIDRFGHFGINAGLLNAFSIIIPEKFDIEIYEVFKVREPWGQSTIFSSFLQSIIWRRHDTIKPNSWEYIRKHINQSEDALIGFFNTVILLSANPTNYFNANFIHSLLIPLSIAERDYSWSLMIDRIWQRNDTNSIKRIIDWCWSEEDKNYTKDESIILLGKILAWLFTTSNRYIRDKATKAFATLFKNRVHLLNDFIDEFKLVNDPYVLERIIAGSFGAITHNSDISKSSLLAQYIYDEFFSNRRPPLNVLTRDYCKGIIEFTVNKGAALKYDKKNLIPPFDYDFPTDIPGKEWVRKKQIRKKGAYTNEEMGEAQIENSVFTWDFARYILGTNYGNSTPFTSYPIKSRLAHEILRAKLRGNKKKFFDMYVSATSMLNGSSDLGKKMRHLTVFDELLEKAKGFLQLSHNYLLKNLSQKQLLLFETAKPFINDGFETDKYKQKRFDVKLIQHFIFKRVYDLGWTKKLFGRYDSKIDESSRSASKPERIGKKYQWIAYYEIMALLTDNFDFIEKYNDERENYIGTWQHNFRNIDPTSIIKPDAEKTEDDSVWWIKETYSNWQEARDPWLTQFSDMPDFEKLVSIKDESGVDWYLFYDRVVWKSERKMGSERYRAGRRELWIDINALLVDKTTKNILIEKGDKKIYWFRDNISENPHYYDIFLGELYYSVAYTEQLSESFSRYPHSSFRLDSKTLNVIRTVEEYSFSDEYDLSESKINIYKPSKFLFELLNGQVGENDACIYDKRGNIIAYDPGAFNKKKGHGCLLVKKDVLNECLKTNNLELIWMFLGEKEDIGPNTSFVYRMLFSGFMSFEKEKFKLQYYHEREKAR